MTDMDVCPACKCNVLIIRDRRDMRSRRAECVDCGLDAEESPPLTAEEVWNLQAKEWKGQVIA